SPPDAPATQRISLSRATAAELERLPGIGPALARRIVAYRDSAGPFRSVAELERVKGVGPALLKRLQSRVDP
ncbi:MAG: helix-hairpin-helix domain-containing protein, partial [Gemmatimonadetes bacterium]|nr:helix-hairpin-helix domain-containing protein [Gemmatimonadota bacterium]